MAGHLVKYPIVSIITPQKIIFLLMSSGVLKVELYYSSKYCQFHHYLPGTHFIYPSSFPQIITGSQSTNPVSFI